MATVGRKLKKRKIEKKRKEKKKKKKRGRTEKRHVIQSSQSIIVGITLRSPTLRMLGTHSVIFFCPQYNEYMFAQVLRIKREREREGGDTLIGGRRSTVDRNHESK
ncbi:hypothetical protein PUN28_001662 [Cardiocondyla obscurior]|uniref:Uncharacterized protein n=1 Tax=Cardiocondyla obscurior TaxID=286306 RepID=A0AAW2GQN3_9HYME